MSFRDERDAMRARIEKLEGELAEAQERLAEHEAVAVEPPSPPTPEPAEPPPPPPRASFFPPPPSPAAPAAALVGPRPDAASPEGRSIIATSARAVGWALLAVLPLGLGALWCAPVTWTAAHASPTLVVVDLDETPPPVPIHGVASGWRDPPSGCAGYYPHAPQILIQTSLPRPIHFSLPSGNLLVVLGPNGEVHCEPALHLLLAPGEHRVWVGTADGGEERFSLTLEADGS